MQKLFVTKENESFAVQGLPPDSKRVIKINGPLARQLADHILHQTDLEFADGCLDAINIAPANPPVIREGLWRSAIVHVMKCFGSNGSRSSLPESKILKSQPAEAKFVFDYFKNIRNKFIVHDENAWAQAMVGAAINDGSKDYKVELVIALAGIANTLDQANYGNLKLLIGASLAYSQAEFERLTGQIKQNLEKIPYEELAQRDAPHYRAPEVHEVSERRAKTE